MIFRKHITAGLLLASLSAVSLSAGASGIPLIGKKKKTGDELLPSRKPTPAQNQLIDKSILREKAVIKAVKERSPMVETYIQNMRPDPLLSQIPESDQHFLGRVAFSKIIGDATYQENADVTHSTTGKEGRFGFLKHSASYVTGLGSSLHLNFHEAGFVQMLLMDSTSFDRQHYVFSYVRNDFLGNTPTAVFDVAPIPTKEGKLALTGTTAGRFYGRIWIETRNGNVVRFNGDFAGTEKTIREYYHFDSWRTNVQPDLWLPTSFYVEESDPKSSSRTLKFKAINHIWGYLLKVPALETSESTNLEVVGANDVTTDAQDVSPLGAQREWVKQAEDNVVERLYQSGLIDAPSDFDKTLEALAGNILAYNGITLSRPIRCRTLLTEPLESLAVGNTIIISKSLLDTTGIVTQDGAQQMGNLNAILAFQLAHVILGHRLDTKYAFNDRLLFPTTSVFKRIPMHHTDEDNAAAAKKAVELLNAKELTDGQQYFGLYLQQLQQRVKTLRALNEPMIGDALVKGDNDPTFWMQALVSKGPKLDMKDLHQQAAMPLSSFLRYDPWTDQVITMHSAFEPLLTPADKMPFEVEPVYLKLSYYKPPADPAAAPATPAAAATPAAPATSSPADAAPAAAAGAPAPAATPAPQN